MPEQNVVSVFHVIHLSHNNSINPVITDMHQSVLADIRLSLGLAKMIAKICMSHIICPCISNKQISNSHRT